MPAGARLAGTILLGGLGVAIIAATALLPAYASLQTQQYHRDREAAQAQFLAAQVRANRNVLAAAETDPVFVERLALSQGELVATDKAPFGPAGAATIPDVVIPPAPPAPKPPPQWLLAMVQRIDTPAMTRGLYATGAAVLLTAMLLFGRAVPAPCRRPPQRAGPGRAERA